MKQISVRQINKLKKDMFSYNFNELSSHDNSKIIVRFQDEIDIVTYNDLQFYGNNKIYK